MKHSVHHSRPALTAVVLAGLLNALPVTGLAGTMPLADDKKQPPPTPKMMEEYRLGPGDKLRIEVYKDAQLSQSVQVRPDGKITMPLIGDLEANERTPLELRDTIA